MTTPVQHSDAHALLEALADPAIPIEQIAQQARQLQQRYDPKAANLDIITGMVLEAIDDPSMSPEQVTHYAHGLYSLAEYASSSAGVKHLRDRFAAERARQTWRGPAVPYSRQPQPDEPAIARVLDVLLDAQLAKHPQTAWEYQSR